MTETAPENRLFELTAYLVACSRLSLDEPTIYGSFRLVEGVVRLVDAAEALGIPVDPAVISARDEIQLEKLRMIDDADGYRAWLDRLLTRISAEAARRNLEPTIL